MFGIVGLVKQICFADFAYILSLCVHVPECVCARVCVSITFLHKRMLPSR